MKKFQNILFLMTLWLSGCGGTHIRTNMNNADIYVDGQYVGTGTAEVNKMGFAKTSNVRVEHKGVVVHQEMKRRFSATTAIIGLVTYCTGFFWAWEYPSEVHVVFSNKESSGHGDWSHSRDEQDWSKPMYTPPPQTRKPESTSDVQPSLDQETPRSTAPKSLDRSAKRTDTKLQSEIVKSQKTPKPKATPSDPWLALVKDKRPKAD